MPDFEPLLDRLLADAGTVIKKTPTKLVTRHDFAGEPLYLKRYINGVGLRPLKYFFKPSEARNEWRLAQEYTARGIPLVRHLALGERRGAFGLYESLLITAGFAGEPLSRSGHDQRPDVQHALGKLLRLMHDKGVLQPDLHHNILVRVDPVELCRIDVDRGELKPALTDDECIANLAWLHTSVPLSDEFFTAYGATPDFAERVREMSAVMTKSHRVRQARRALGTNLRFQRQHHGNLAWWVRLDFLNDKLRTLLTDPDGALASGRRMFKSGPNRQATIGAFDGLVLKRFNQKNRWNYLKDLFRPSRAYRAYQRAYHLELLGIATPRPIAAAERRMSRILLNSYLVTEEIVGATDLRRAETLDVEVARNAGHLIGQLHAAGFSHGDLKETNIVWDAAGKVYILDLDALDYVKEIAPELAAENLRRLARGATQSKLVTEAHRKAFLKGYFETRGSAAPC